VQETKDAKMVLAPFDVAMGRSARSTGVSLSQASQNHSFRRENAVNWGLSRGLT
jgi:hypothetical protein